MEITFRIRHTIGRLPLIAAAFTFLPAYAEDYPARPVSIVVPFAPGGPSDVSARVVAKALSEEFGSQFVVENLPGAGAVVGTTKVANAKPDGYSLLWGTSSALAMAPNLNPNITYDPVKSFAPIAQVTAAPFVLITKPSLGVKTVSELVKLARTKPEKLNYGSTGAGGSAHMITELFKATARIDAVHVPYKGGAPMINAVLGGEVDFAFDTPTTVAPLIEADRVVPLAVTSMERWPGLPDVKTLSELGFSDFDATAWFGLLAPKGTPSDRVELLSGKVAEAMKKDEVVASLRAAGFFVRPSSPEGFARKIAQEGERWGDIARTANIKIE